MHVKRIVSYHKLMESDTETWLWSADPDNFLKVDTVKILRRSGAVYRLVVRRVVATVALRRRSINVGLPVSTKRAVSTLRSRSSFATKKPTSSLSTLILRWSTCEPLTSYAYCIPSRGLNLTSIIWPPGYCSHCASVVPFDLWVQVKNDHIWNVNIFNFSHHCTVRDCRRFIVTSRFSRHPAKWLMSKR